MPRTLLAGLAVIGLVACGGGAEQQGVKADTRSAATSKPAATRSSTTRPKAATAPAKRKAAADTSTRNPLQND